MRQPTFFMAFDYDYTGNPALLDCRKVAFFASRVVSPTVEEQVLRWAEACCATDRVVISGFQSPLEKFVLELLLKARHPVIWALGRALYRRYPPAVEEALAEQRILIFAVRNARRDANSAIERAVKEDSLPEDDERRAQAEVQKLTDKYVAQVDEAFKKKEADVMEI